VIRTDHILITAIAIGPIGIIPSRTYIEFSKSLGAYVGVGQIINLTKKRQQCVVIGKIEVVNTFMVIPLNKGNMSRVRHILERCPLGREILPCHSESGIEVSLYSINMSLVENSVMLVNDSDFSDIVSAKEPTYDGEAEIIPEIIEPSGGGLDIPTIIHGSAAEAINLSVYPEEIRKRIEDIFIKKYPQVVSLHSLDAGDVSGTLGLTQLRLRKGESLPRSKQIFHISSSER
jgi:hypothetical protein